MESLAQAMKQAEGGRSLERKAAAHGHAKVMLTALQCKSTKQAQRDAMPEVDKSNLKPRTTHHIIYTLYRNLPMTLNLLC